MIEANTFAQGPQNTKLIAQTNVQWTLDTLMSKPKAWHISCLNKARKSHTMENLSENQLEKADKGLTFT